MLKKSDIVAVCCSDLHLSAKPPLFRSGEPDWFTAMARPLTQVRNLCEQLGVPLLIAGDIFDRWNAPAELINFAIEQLPPQTYAIPGQHDMPFHDLGLLRKSAYWTLASSKQIRHIDAQTITQNDFYLTGFAWGEKPKRPTTTDTGALQIALVHDYYYIGDCHHPEPDTTRKVNGGTFPIDYQTVIIGDNHIPWTWGCYGHQWVFNCGNFMTRKSDEAKNPRVGLITCEGTITPHPLDVSADLYNHDVRAVDERAAEKLMTDLMEDFKVVKGERGMDYAQTLRRLAPKCGRIVEKLIEEALESYGA